MAIKAPAQSSAPLTGDELVDALDEVLEAHPAGDRVPYLSTIDGILAALVLSPEPVPSEEWLPHCLAGPEAGFDDPLVTERFPALLRQRQDEIRALLLEGGLAFVPIYDYDEEDEPQWQLWLVGFLGAIRLRSDAWTVVFESDDEDLATAALGIISLSAALPGLSGAIEDAGEVPELGDAIEHAPMLLPYFVETIYRRLQGLERVPMGDDDVELPLA